MKIMNRIITICLVLLMILSSVMAFAADSLSYERGYDAGYDYGTDRSGTGTSARSGYSRFSGTKAYRDLKGDIDDFVESEFREGFLAGFADGYDNEKGEAKTENYPADLGKSLGEIYGARDFQNGKKSDWKKALPSRTDIRNMYDLDKQNSVYRNKFTSDFNAAFEVGYIEAYNKAMFEPPKITQEQGLEDGETVGANFGAAYGAKDFYEDRVASFERDLPTRVEIIREFSLANDQSEYENGFIAGFIRAYEEAYFEAYREANMSKSLVKIASELIPISGGKVVTEDNRFSVDILEGAFYHDVNLTITTYFDAANRQSGNLIKSSDTYNVKLVNTSGNEDDSKLIELSFEFYGDKIQGGIYRQEGSRWLYIPTRIEDGVMTAKVKPSSLHSSGTSFSAFVDKNTKVFRDVRGHWASDVIDTYVRRGVIQGYSDMTFKPDNNISRAEFVTLLSRVFNWSVSWNPGNKIAFKDADTFGSFSNVINYAAYYGYINGYDDGTFKPNNPISYTEVEIIMNRVMRGSFRWSNVANSMLYDKKVKTNSFDSMSNKITRAEVAYMLFSVTE